MPVSAAPVTHLARPHRPVVVAGNLGELCGPTAGFAELPLRLWWHPQRAFDLSQHTMLLWMYENVLREAIRIDELRNHLDGATLVRVWPELNLPRGVRAAWEARHPRLRPRVTALASPPDYVPSPFASAAEPNSAAGHDDGGHP